MWILHNYIKLCIVFSVVLGLRQVNSQWYKKEGNKILPYYTITVAKSGHANFSTIQSAINSIPSNNHHWVCIRIEAGIYREKVKIPHDKPYIVLKGKGKRGTQVVWDDHHSVSQSPTFSSMADNIFVKSISFKNSYNLRGNKNPRQPAVAAMIMGDKTRFVRCGFYGLQDTLWDEQGRHYYEKCTIQGAVDFIFGTAQSIFESCNIAVLGGAIEPGFVGYITAQGRNNPKDTNGFVFKNCQIFGTGKVFLGRPWRGSSRVLFYNSNISNVVVPLGWDAWNFISRVGQLTFAEESCYGAGSNKSKRVSWEKKLSPKAVKELTSQRFIDSDGWIRKQPY